MIGPRDIRREEGQAAVEFALITPILIVLLLAVIQVGVAFHNYITITDAARSGARTAAVARFSGANIPQLQQAVRDSASDLDQSKLEVTVADPTWTVSGSDLTVTAKYPYSINLLGWVVSSGYLTSTTTERLE